MPDEPKPRFKLEDLLPKDFGDDVSNAFEAELRRQGIAETARGVAEAAKPIVMAAVFRTAAQAVDGLADELAKAEINCDDPARRGGIEAAMKMVIEHARERAKFLRGMADKHSPEPEEE